MGRPTAHWNAIMTIPDLPERDADYLRIAQYLQGECSPGDAARIESEMAVDDRMQFAAQLLSLAHTPAARPEASETDAGLAELARRIGEPGRPRWRFRRRLKHTEIFAGAVSLLLFAWATYKTTAPIVVAHANEHYEAPMESRRVVRLPDGSRATLEPGARVTYRASFFRPPRTLALEGEARFQVRSDEVHPFEVHANGVIAVALGTVFTVRANPWEPSVHVSVEQGTVKVWSETAGAPVHTVSAGQSADVTPPLRHRP
jgi:transmembrane sensor